MHDAVVEFDHLISHFFFSSVDLTLGVFSLSSFDGRRLTRSALINLPFFFALFPFDIEGTFRSRHFLLQLKIKSEIVWIFKNLAQSVTQYDDLLLQL